MINAIARSQINLQKSSLDIAFAVRTQYYETLRAEEELAIRSETVNRLEDYRTLLNQLRLGGGATQGDLLKTQVDLNNAIIAAGAALTGLWYVALAHLIVRARPTTAQVLQVTEHPGASSFPSGHTMFIVTITVVLMLCFGHRFLPRWGRVAGWVLVVLIVIANGISRIYTGAHWPTDVVGGILIATAWLCFWVSIRWVSRNALSDNGLRRERGDAGALRGRREPST